MTSLEPDEDFFESDLNRPRRTTTLTYVLIAGLVAAVAFAGGVVLQKNNDARLLATVGRGPAVAPVATGTVRSISGSTLTVTDPAGTAVAVSVPATASVTTSGLGGLAVGATVSVVGVPNADGTVTASSVTSGGPADR